MPRKKDILEEFLKKTPTTWDAMLIARARWVMAAALRNFARNLLHEVENMAEQGAMADFLFRDIFLPLWDIYQPDTDDDEENAQAIIKAMEEGKEDFSKVWSIMSHMLRSFIAAQEDNAYTFRRLAEDETDLDNVNFYWGKGVQ